MTDVLLELRDVSKRFGGINAVRNLSFQVHKGTIVGLIGPNGAGKTTAFNLISGAYRPDSGSIIFSGLDVTGRKAHAMAQLGVGRTFQTVRPFPRMTVIENLQVAGLFGRNHSYSLRTARERAQEILTYLGLVEKSNSLAGTLTLAEQRRLELARALAAQPIFLMLDEIMAGLTYGEMAETLQFLRKLTAEKQITLLVIEHVMKAIMQLCDHVIVMNQGQKLAEGTPNEISSNEIVIRAYMGEKKSDHRI